MSAYHEDSIAPGAKLNAQMTRRATILGALLLSSTPALAHGGAEIADETAWSSWRLTSDIVIPIALVTAIYIAGMVRRRTAKLSAPWWRHTMFFSGMASIFFALQSPIDPIAERLFFMHQIQHLLLRMLGPMLLTLSWPQGLLTAGLPATIRRSVLAPLISNVGVRWSFAVLTQPVIATVLFVLALYFWEIPRYHDLALRDDPIHYLMHATMLLTGLTFWWRVFDRRAPKSATDLDDEPATRRPMSFRPLPHGIGYGVRLMMLWIVILSNILLGAYTTLKTTVLYDGYDTLGRLFGYSSLTDEQIGGIIIWIPSSMMCLAAVLIVIHLLGLHETRLERQRLAQSTSNSAALLYPATGAALIERARPKNRAMAAGFAVFVLSVFITAILVGVLYNLSDTIGSTSPAPASMTHVLQQLGSPTS